MKDWQEGFRGLSAHSRLHARVHLGHAASAPALALAVSLIVFRVRM